MTAQEGAGSGTVLIKRIKKGGHAHHGGAWKIAYADFVTAMMAFFLLLWLLNAVTQEQLEGISDYFAPTTSTKSQSGSGAILGGTVVATEGAGTALSQSDEVSFDLPEPQAGTGGQTEAEQQNAEEVARQVEQDQVDDAKQSLDNAINALPEAEQIKESLRIDDTPEGLRIQLIDSEGQALFESGSAVPVERMRQLLMLVVDVIKTMPQNFAISGHTDAVAFSAGGDYSNWELSADRANATRRVLEEFGVAERRVGRVVGKAATDPLKPNDPTDPSNRRLSIILLRGTGDPPADPTEDPTADPTEDPTDDPPQDEQAGGGQTNEQEVLPGLDKIRERQLEEDKALVNEN